MRLRVMGQMAKGLVDERNMTSAQEVLTEANEELESVDIGKQFERVKWFLWHGNVAGALDTIEDIEDELDLLPKDGENFAAISKRTKTSSQIMGIVTGTERRFQRPSRSPR